MPPSSSFSGKPDKNSLLSSKIKTKTIEQDSEDGDENSTFSPTYSIIRKLVMS